MQESHRIEYLKLFITNEVAHALQGLSQLPLSLPIIRVLIVQNEVTETSSPLPFPFDPLLSTSFHTFHVSDFTLGQVSRAFHPGIREMVLSLSDEDNIGNQVEGGGGENQGEFVD